MGTNPGIRGKHKLGAGMGVMDSKALRLLSVLTSDPQEFLERSIMIAGGKLASLHSRKASYQGADWRSVVAKLSDFSGHSFEAALGETQLSDLAARLRERMKMMRADAPFGAFHNGDLVLAELCYAVVRVMRPKIALETGVCYGVTSSHLLAALEGNSEGHLYSIDLPPLGRNANYYVGWLVPEDFRKRWTLQRGTSRKLLGPMLDELRSINLFVH